MIFFELRCNFSDSSEIIIFLILKELIARKMGNSPSQYPPASKMGNSPSQYSPASTSDFKRCFYDEKKENIDQARKFFATPFPNNPNAPTSEFNYCINYDFTNL